MLMEPVRINKALADAGICSRRKADELILAGVVNVNGKPVDSPGLRVRPDVDVIEVNGQRLRAQTGDRRPCCLMLHKPVSVVCTARDPDGRRTVLNFVPPQWRERRLYPAGRLDFFSEGLVLLTDDGDLTHRLIHPSRDEGLHLARVYHVLVRGNVSPKTLETMRGGMTLAEGDYAAPVQARILPASPYLDRGGKKRRAVPPGAVILELTLHQGLNREIRRICRDLGLTVLRLLRVAQGPLELGDLAPGAVRPLGDEELATLRRAVGLP